MSEEGFLLEWESDKKEVRSKVISKKCFSFKSPCQIVQGDRIFRYWAKFFKEQEFLFMRRKLSHEFNLNSIFLANFCKKAGGPLTELSHFKG